MSAFPLLAAKEVADDVVAVLEHLQARHPGNVQLRRVLGAEFPDDLSVRRDLDDALLRAAGNQRVAVLQPERLAGVLDPLELPDHFARRIDLADRPLSLMGG